MLRCARGDAATGPRQALPLGPAPPCPPHGAAGRQLMCSPERSGLRRRLTGCPVPACLLCALAAVVHGHLTRAQAILTTQAEVPGLNARCLCNLVWSIVKLEVVSAEDGHPLARDVAIASVPLVLCFIKECSGQVRPALHARDARLCAVRVGRARADLCVSRLPVAPAGPGEPAVELRQDPELAAAGARLNHRAHGRAAGAAQLVQHPGRAGAQQHHLGHRARAHLAVHRARQLVRVEQRRDQLPAAHGQPVHRAAHQRGRGRRAAAAAEGGAGRGRGWAGRARRRRALLLPGAPAFVPQGRPRSALVLVRDGSTRALRATRLLRRRPSSTSSGASAPSWGPPAASRSQCARSSSSSASSPWPGPRPCCPMLVRAFNALESRTLAHKNLTHSFPCANAPRLLAGCR